MKASDIKIGEWYHIHYVPSKNSKRSYVGPAKCLSAYNEKYNEIGFYSPANTSEHGLQQMFFRLRDVKYACNPLPTYEELYEKVFGTELNISNKQKIK